MKKQMVNITTIGVERGDLFGDINDVISFLSKIRDKYKNGECVEVVEDWSGYEDNYFKIQVTRLETDDECLKREEKEEKELIKEKENQEKLRAEVARKEKIKEQIKQLQKNL
jgi:ribosomal protein L9